MKKVKKNKSTSKVKTSHVTSGKFNSVNEKIRKQYGIVGRETEIKKIWTALSACRNLLIEGPVGVGKTVLVQSMVEVLDKPFIRVDGDSRYTEQKLTGWFDPGLVIKSGYNAKTFIAGPLVKAMQTGAVLFINELNRMPEAVQNVLLPALDEGVVEIPQLGRIQAKPGFLLVATQNPREFVATSHLSEALMDRMEWVVLGYQSFEEEHQIAKQQSEFSLEPFATWAVGIARMTRNHPKIKRGASVRAAIAVLKLLKAVASEKGDITDEDFFDAVKMSLPTRIELNTTEIDADYSTATTQVLRELFDEVKKKTSDPKLNAELYDSLEILENPGGELTQEERTTKAIFVAPELVDLHASQDASGFESKTSWDVAVRFQDLKRLGHIPPKEKLRLKQRAISGVFEKAKKVLGAVLKPEKTVVTDFDTFLQTGSRGELDILSTFDEAPEIFSTLKYSSNLLRFQTKLEKQKDIFVIMDASLSMKGEKIALLAVATAVVALCVPSSRLSVLGFDSHICWVKKFSQSVELNNLIERVLELPAGGFTNMEIALQEALNELKRANKEEANVILITDGKYTEGADPTELARSFKHLHILKIGKDQAGRSLLVDLSQKGRGKFFEAKKTAELPKTLYNAMRSLLR